MDATVFVEPLPDVSDLLFVPHNDPSRAYYKRALQEQDCDLTDVFKLPRSLRSKYWMAAANPEECGGLFETELPALLASRRWCIVQVVGGHCVVMTSQWHGNRPSHAPGTVEAILVAPAAVAPEGSDPTMPGYAGESTALATAVAEPEPARPMRADYSPEPAPVAQATAASTRTTPRRRRPHSTVAKVCLLGFGIRRSAQRD